jgi:hypothetical protein
MNLKTKTTRKRRRRRRRRKRKRKKNLVKKHVRRHLDLLQSKKTNLDHEWEWV